MASRFQYDESGSRFALFLLSFFTLLLLPITYYIWRKIKHRDFRSDSKLNCACSLCTKQKESSLDKNLERAKMYWWILLTVLWCMFFLGVAYTYKSQEVEKIHFDPYEILDVSTTSSRKEIRKKYLDLVVTHHPDHGGDAKEFEKISKAYRVLTNEADKKKWSEFGDPDGPRAVSFGIALPSWLVDKNNSKIVLFVYFISIIIILPVVVAWWWYRSRKYSPFNILHDTERLFCCFIVKTPDLSWKRMITIVSGSFEYLYLQKTLSTEEIDELVKFLRAQDLMSEAKGEPPFGAPYSVFARTMIYAHMLRHQFALESLELKKQKVITKSIHLFAELARNIVSLHIAAENKLLPRGPPLKVLDSCISVAACIVQAMMPYDVSLMQIPCFPHSSSLDYIFCVKKNIETIPLLVKSLRSNSLFQKSKLSSPPCMKEIFSVASVIPKLRVKISIEASDDVSETGHRTNSTVVSGSIITLFVDIQRSGITKYRQNCSDAEEPLKEQEECDSKKNENSEIAKNDSNPQPRSRKNKRKDKTNASVAVAPSQTTKNIEAAKTETNDEDAGDEVPNMFENAKSDTSKSICRPLNPENFFVCHAPRFPSVKKEGWWIYVTDCDQGKLCIAPQYLTGFTSEVTRVTLQMMAPNHVGTKNYLCKLRSDCYVDSNASASFQIKVTETARMMDVGSHWDLSDKDYDSEICSDTEVDIS